MTYPFDSVVFDLDGTLLDTLPGIHAALSALLAEENLPAPDREAVRRMIGDGAGALVRRGFEAAGRQLEEAEAERMHRRFLELYEADPAQGSAPYPGARELVDALRAAGRRLGICTNKPQQATELLLERFGFADCFASVLGGDRLPFRKPDPRHLAAVLDGLEASPSRTVMVGDSRNDVEAARGLGLPCILLRHGYGPDPADRLGADEVVEDLFELTHLLLG